MSLPTKKQLHKHKRGTRKALDTLDAMQVFSNESNESEIVKEKSGGKKTKISLGAKEKPRGKSKRLIDNNQLTLDHTIKDKSADKIQKKNLLLEASEVAQEVTISKESANKNNDSNKRGKLNKQPEKKELKIRHSKQLQKSKKQDAPEVLDPEGDNAEDEDTQKDRYLTFHLGREDYGIEIQYVIEIIVMHKITEVPDTPRYIKGVINLRGSVIPVMDVREKFGLESRDYDERTCIVVVNYNEVIVGLIVDTVSEVLDIPENLIDPPPRAHSDKKNNYLKGMGKIGDQVKILLNIQKILHLEEANS